MSKHAPKIIRFGREEAAQETRGGSRPGAGRKPKERPDGELRVPMKVYVRESLRDDLSRRARAEYGKDSRRNDLIEKILEEFLASATTGEER
jgi:hypothetical protein